MKPTPRISSHCLLCFTKCSTTVVGDDITPKIAATGGQNCLLLERQLEKMFILLEILDVPISWCAQMLEKQQAQSNQEKGVSLAGPESWFSVCKQCINGNVLKAWNVHMKILTLKAEMTSVKNEIKNVMRGKVLDESHNNYDYRAKKTEGFVCEITKLLFPDLSIKLETPGDDSDTESYLADSDPMDTGEVLLYEDIDEHVNYSDDEDFILPASVPLKLEKLEPAVINTNSVVPKKRGRGRPPKKLKEAQSPATDLQSSTLNAERLDEVNLKLKGEKKNPNTSLPKKRGRPRLKFKKPSFRHPLYYYTPHWGTLKRKQFHWKICRKCDSRYKTQEEYDAHERAHRDKDNGNKEIFSCSQCPYPARSTHELDYHIRSRHLKPKQVKKNYSCTKCSFQTGIWKMLKEHVDKEHSAVAEEELGTWIILHCDICNKKFKNMQAFTLHKTRIHPGLEATSTIVQCPDCHLKFPSKRLLMSHERSTHKRQSRFVCEHCGMGFQFQSELAQHKLTHVDKNKKPEFICHLCGLDFHDKRRLGNHVSKSHKNSVPVTNDTPEKLYKCRYCDVTSPFNFVIKRHLETHKEALGHRCDVCGKCYTNAQGLNRHIKYIHTLDGPWPCPYCAKEFPCDQYLKDHVKKYCRVKELSARGTAEAVLNTDTNVTQQTFDVQRVEASWSSVHGNTTKTEVITSNVGT